MKYHQALDLLNRRGNEVRGMHLGLHRTATIMRALGAPHLQAPVLHIAGTNGKGSVAAMAESILRQGGWKTGLYTSPHLLRVEERIRVAGRDVSARRFAAAAAHIAQVESALLRRRALDRPLTYYEFVTACGFWHFAEEQVDISIVEVGLGGALDATNVVRPQVSVITGISYDHQNLLGNTLREIAGEKAGIIKPRVPVVSGCRNPAARRVLRKKAREAAAPLREVFWDCTIDITGKNRGRCCIDLKTPKRTYRRLRISLAGEHQTRNAALAVAAIEELRSFPVTIAAVRRGLANTCWPGRIEEYRGPRRTLVDGAHNLESARALRKHLLWLGAREMHLVFAALCDKDLRGISRCLFPLAKSIHLAPLDNPRSALPGDMADLQRRFCGRMMLHHSAREALRSAWQACPATGLVVVTGSLYLVGEVLPLLRRSARD